MYWAEYKHNECNYNEFLLKNMVIWRPFCFSPFKPLSSNLAAVQHTFLNSAYPKYTKKVYGTKYYKNACACYIY